MGVTIGEPTKYYKKKFVPIMKEEEQTYEIEKQNKYEIPFQSYTVTQPMSDGIGNVIDINIENNTCSVKCVWRGNECVLNNVIIWDNNIKSKHDRVMVTEHLNIDGHMELVATKKRILMQGFNYFNFGWESKTSRRIIVVDVYTGEWRKVSQRKG